jgi:type IV pilus assembly protein PilA
MFCQNCGTANAVNSQFCNKCGAPLQAQATSPAVGGMGTSGATPPHTSPQVSSGKALASLICGIFFFVFPSAIAAIILGHISLSEIRKSAGRLTGHGMAVAGLVLGYLGVAVIPFMLIVAAIAIPNLLRARMAANEASAVGSLRVINTAALTYSTEFANGFPPDLEVLGRNGGVRDCNHAQMIDQSLVTGQKYGYVFTYRAGVGGDTSERSITRNAAKGCTSAGTSSYSVTADPVQRNTTGTRSFYTDQTGIIRYSSDAATVDSPALE